MTGYVLASEDRELGARFEFTCDCEGEARALASQVSVLWRCAVALEHELTGRLITIVDASRAA